MAAKTQMMRTGHSEARSVNAAWRSRLRDAIRRTGRKHSDVAWGAGVTPVTLSRILNDERCMPYFATVCRIAREIGVTVGWLLVEEEFRIGEVERKELRDAAHVILRLTGE